MKQILQEKLLKPFKEKNIYFMNKKHFTWKNFFSVN